MQKRMECNPSLLSCISCFAFLMERSPSATDNGGAVLHPRPRWVAVYTAEMQRSAPER